MMLLHYFWVLNQISTFVELSMSNPFVQMVRCSCFHEAQALLDNCRIMQENMIIRFHSVHAAYSALLSLKQNGDKPNINAF